MTGARCWYALHGYAVEPPVTRRGSIGHGRVLPPGERSALSARPMARQLVVKAARRLRREGFLARRLTLSADCLDAPSWTASTLVERANDDLTCLGVLSALWTALTRARGRAALFRVTVSFDRLVPSDEAQLELPFGKPDEGAGWEGLPPPSIRSMAAMRAPSSATAGVLLRAATRGPRCVRPHSSTGGFPVVALCLGDYAEGDWYFIAVCKNCGREKALEPAEILARPGTEKCIAECAWKTWNPSCAAGNAAPGSASRTGRQNSQARFRRRDDLKGKALFGNAGYVPPPE